MADNSNGDINIVNISNNSNYSSYLNDNLLESMNGVNATVGTTGNDSSTEYSFSKSYTNASNPNSAHQTEKNNALLRKDEIDILGKMFKNDENT